MDLSSHYEIILINIFQKDFTRIKRVNSYKKITPPSTQNLKTLNLWIFFL